MIGETLSSIRQKQGITRAQLAKSADVSTQFIQQIESGKKSASLSTAAKIAAALGCTIDDLMSGTIHTSSISQERT